MRIRPLILANCAKPVHYRNAPPIRLSDLQGKKSAHNTMPHRPFARPCSANHSVRKSRATIASRYVSDRDVAYGVASCCVRRRFESSGVAHRRFGSEVSGRYDCPMQLSSHPPRAAGTGTFKPGAGLCNAWCCELRPGAARLQLLQLANLYPVYLRGEAYLAAQSGAKAAAESQKIIAHRGLVLNEPIGALAYLGLALLGGHFPETARGLALLIKISLPFGGMLIQRFQY